MLVNATKSTLPYPLAYSSHNSFLKANGSGMSAVLVRGAGVKKSLWLLSHTSARGPGRHWEGPALSAHVPPAF